MDNKKTPTPENTVPSADELLDELNNVLADSPFADNTDEESDESDVKIAVPKSAPAPVSEDVSEADVIASVNESFEELDSLLKSELGEPDSPTPTPEQASRATPSPSAFKNRPELVVEKSELGKEPSKTQEFIRSTNKPLNKREPETAGESAGETKAMPVTPPANAKKIADEKVTKKIEEAIRIKKLGEAVGNAEDVQQVKEETSARTKQEQDEFEFNVAFGLDNVSDADLDKFTRYDDYGNKIGTGAECGLFKRRSELPKVRVEYTSAEQNKEIFDSYRRNSFRLNIKLLCAAVLLFLSLYLEMAPTLKWSLPSYMNLEMYNVVYILIDIQILALAAGLVLRQLLDGIVSLFKLEPKVSSITMLTILVAGLHSILTYHMRHNRSDFMLYSAVGVLCVALQLVYEIISVRRELYSFNVVSSKKPKFIVTPLVDRKMERENFADKIPENGEYYSIDTIPFVEQFYARASTPVDSSLFLRYIIPAVVFVAVAFLCICLALKKEEYTTLSAAVLIILAGLPSAAYLAVMLPLYTSSHNAFRTKAALIGGTGLNDYTAPALVSLEDTDIFAPASTQLHSCKIYGNHSFQDVIFLVSKIFEKLGGPLSKVFTSILSENIALNSAVVRFNEVAENGLDVMVNGKQILIGRKSYFKAIGVAIPYDDQDNVFEKSSGCIMYMTVNGDFAAKILIKYQLDRSFEDSLRLMAKAGMSASIRTRDPNINDAMLRKFFRADQLPVKVLKILTDVRPAKETYTSSGIVSRESVSSLLRALVISGKVKKTIRNNNILKTLSIIVGCGFIIAMAIFGSILSVNTAVIVLLQLLWLLPILAISNVNA